MTRLLFPFRELHLYEMTRQEGYWRLYCPDCGRERRWYPDGHITTIIPGDEQAQHQGGNAAALAEIVQDTVDNGRQSVV